MPAILTGPVRVLDERVDDGDGLVGEPRPGLGAEGGKAHHGPHRQPAATCKKKKTKVDCFETSQ